MNRKLCFKKSAMNNFPNSRPKKNGRENESICQREDFSIVNKSACSQKEIFAEKEESVLCMKDYQSDVDESVFSVKDDATNADKLVSSQREIEFCELYFNVIDKQLARGNYEENIKKAECQFHEIRSKANTWCRFKKGIDPEQIVAFKNSCYYRMICIYSNATCISSAVAYHFDNFLKQKSKYLKKILKKNVLKICSVGGGLPADIIAFIKVLESSNYIKEDLQIHVTIIDVDTKWKKPCLAVLQNMKNFNKKRWKMDFLRLDLSSTSLSPEIETAIKEADLVSFLKFLDLSQDKDSDFKRNLFQKLHHLISTGSILFLMDHANIEAISVFGGYFGRLRRHKLLYDEVCHLHTLQQSTVERHYHLYNKHLLSSGMSNTSFKLFCRVWVKTNATSHPQFGRGGKSLEEKKAWQGQLQSLCDQLSKHNISEETVDWKEVFVIEMTNQGCSEKTILHALEDSEEDLVLREMFAKELMFASYQDFLEEETHESLKNEKRMDFHKKLKSADFNLKTYNACNKKLLRNLARSQCSETT